MDEMSGTKNELSNDDAFYDGKPVYYMVLTGVRGDAKLCTCMTPHCMSCIARLDLQARRNEHNYPLPAMCRAHEVTHYLVARASASNDGLCHCPDHTAGMTPSPMDHADVFCSL